MMDSLAALTFFYLYYVWINIKIVLVFVMYVVEFDWILCAENHSHCHLSILITKFNWTIMSSNLFDMLIKDRSHMLPDVF